MMKMGGNAAFSFRFSFVTEGLGGNAPFFKVFLTIFSVFERQCTVFLTLLGPIYRLGLDRFLGGYAPFYPNRAIYIDITTFYVNILSRWNHTSILKYYCPNANCNNNQDSF